jgi:hypothetical protein
MAFGFETGLAGGGGSTSRCPADRTPPGHLF